MRGFIELIYYNVGEMLRHYFQRYFIFQLHIQETNEKIVNKGNFDDFFFFENGRKIVNPYWLWTHSLGFTLWNLPTLLLVALYEFSYFLKVTAVWRKFWLEQDLFRDTYVELQLTVVEIECRGVQISQFS